MNLITDILGYEFNQRALLAAVMIGFMNGYAGGYVVLRRGALFAESLAHTLFPGIALGALGENDVEPGRRPPGEGMHPLSDGDSNPARRARDEHGIERRMASGGADAPSVQGAAQIPQQEEVALVGHVDEDIDAGVVAEA